MTTGMAARPRPRRTCCSPLCTCSSLRWRCWSPRLPARPPTPTPWLDVLGRPASSCTPCATAPCPTKTARAWWKAATPVWRWSAIWGWGSSANYAAA
ncbi:hypothetical protein F751_0044 [Auxenochlorella protothecoides]|uniref:Uncharacterized protein n=1 Tax=Auxenochlorella protothecoides TaxID=3075 RepID=A0A087S9N8_AUXPR|nr:hypothetical protein F751_0044 [Auxenochlorella protothecoides]KFM22442.1 hypothetical protein F751_0044 [Auxenochlorella protothecoides]